MERERLPLIDGLRAIAALSVFLFHGVYQIAVNRREDHEWYRLGIQLDFGVPLFFALSGFLLYRPFLTGRVRLGDYALRRVLRIVPAFWVALAITTIWFDYEKIKTLGGALQFAGFAQVYSPDTAIYGFGQAWTLDVEAAFYVLLPFAAALAGRIGPRAAALAVIAAGLAWNAFALVRIDAASGRDAFPWLLSLPAHLDTLGVGMLVAAVSVRGSLPRAELGWVVAVAAIVGCALLTPRGMRSAPPLSDPEYLVTHVLRTVAAAGLLLPAVFGSGGRLRRALAWPPLAWVGLVSYSLYLWHYAVIVQLYRWLDRTPGSRPEWVAWVVVTLAGSLVLAALSYYLVERPAMALRRRRTRPAAEAAQAHAAP